jgi:hypothetical protein
MSTSKQRITELIALMVMFYPIALGMIVDFNFLLYCMSAGADPSISLVLWAALMLWGFGCLSYLAKHSVPIRTRNPII